MKNIDPEIVISFLNDIYVKDPVAIKKLIEFRVDTNDILSEHKTVQVAVNVNDNSTKVGLLGILNGLVGVHDESGLGYIAAEYEMVSNENAEIVKFVRTPGTED